MLNDNRVHQLRDIFNKVDPVGLYSSDEDNIDEYDSEISELLNRVKYLHNDDLTELKNELRSIFVKYFSESLIRDEKIDELAKAVFQSSILNQNNIFSNSLFYLFLILILLLTVVLWI